MGRPSGVYRAIGVLTAWPARLLFRIRWTGFEHVPRDSGFVLAANHVSNFDPWPLGIPFLPERWLRFMAKSELFFPPLGWILNAGGAFKVHRGQADTDAIDRAVELARAGEIVVMFPEGTRRAKGMRKKYVARPHTGAARIALLAGVPLVPAAIVGADRLARLGPVRVAYGLPVEVGDLAELDVREAAQVATDRLMAEIERLGGLGVSSGPLLVVDGDSFAHRAYHALPRSIRRAKGRPGNMLVGFTNMLVRLWELEEPRAVLTGWDSLFTPTYRHEAFEAYQSGREFADDLLEQLDLLPELVSAIGFAVAKGEGYEADDFLAAGVAEEERRGGRAVVASGDRDAWQLASERTTVLFPTRGVSEISRMDPAEVRERYGVEPAQIPDFIALRGDPSDKLPGARGVGPKRAAELLKQYGSLDAALEAGRFAAEADALRLYKRIATLDPTAPLPPLDDRTPTWERGAELAREWGLNQLANRLGALA